MNDSLWGNAVWDNVGDKIRMKTAEGRQKDTLLLLYDPEHRNPEHDMHKQFGHLIETLNEFTTLVETPLESQQLVFASRYQCEHGKQ